MSNTGSGPTYTELRKRFEEAEYRPTNGTILVQEYYDRLARVSPETLQKRVEI